MSLIIAKTIPQLPPARPQEIPQGNPSIGGVGKTHIASEVDILGGVICKIGDKSAIHYRVLNLSKGPALT